MKLLITGSNAGILVNKFNLLMSCTWDCYEGCTDCRECNDCRDCNDCRECTDCTECDDCPRIF